MQHITFGQFRKYCCVFDRVSICMQETGQYDNYRFIAHVPSTYDRYYLYGFGLFESEFIDEDFEGWNCTGSALPPPAAYKSGRWSFQPCLEITLSETPRTNFHAKETLTSSTTQKPQDKTKKSAKVGAKIKQQMWADVKCSKQNNE